ncbi:MAG: PspC domain-containing protein [Xanthomonadales bacterium]|nr:PspC domain-containing protein [Xanthomonadales bacterium]
MTTDSIMQEIREALTGRPGQPIVLGVCNAIAMKMGWETWCVRLATIISALFFSGFTLIAYVIAGLLLKETEARTRGFFTGLTIIAREWMEKISSSLSRAFCSNRSDYRGS